MDARSRKQIASFPGHFRRIKADPSGRSWAGALDEYLCLIALEEIAK